MFNIMLDKVLQGSLHGTTTFHVTFAGKSMVMVHMVTIIYISPETFLTFFTLKWLV